MGLIDSLRKAEEQGRNVARKGLERARDAFSDTESRLRRKMRVRPNPNSAPLRPSSRAPAATSGPAAAESLPHHASEEDAA